MEKDSQKTYLGIFKKISDKILQIHHSISHEKIFLEIFLFAFVIWTNLTHKFSVIFYLRRNTNNNPRQKQNNYFTFYIVGIHFHILIRCRMITHFWNSQR